MNRDRHFIFLLSFLLVTALTSLPLQAELPSPPREGTPVQGDSDIDPYSVKFYEDMDYKNQINTWKLPPGMRLQKVNQVNSMYSIGDSGGTTKPQPVLYTGPIGSILLGSKVECILFPEQELTSHIRKLTSYDEVTIPPFAIAAKTNKKYLLIPYKRIESSTPAINTKYLPRVGSFIIFRKDIGDVLGVLLQSGQDWSQFLPFPESPSQTDIIYKKIPAGGPFTLSVESGSKGQWVIKGSGHPRPDDVQVIVEGSNGATRKLIEPNSQELKFDLDKMGIHQVSSVRIIYKGPFGAWAYLPPSPPKTHRAPPAPPPPSHVSPKVIRPDSVSKGRPLATGTMTVEQDTDRPGANLKVFNLDTADPQLCVKACGDEPKCRAYTYVKPGVQGPKARCWLKSGVPSAKPNKCCVSGVKTAQGATAPPVKVPVFEGRPLATGTMTVEQDTDRPGANLRVFNLDTADPQLCAKTCQEDTQCRAYTYVKPGVQGPKARCWLKTGVPAAKPNPCCVSGVKTQAAGQTEIEKPGTKAIPINIPSTGDSKEKEPKR
jgi:hypothetical protein